MRNSIYSLKASLAKPLRTGDEASKKTKFYNAFSISDTNSDTDVHNLKNNIGAFKFPVVVAMGRTFILLILIMGSAHVSWTQDFNRQEEKRVISKVREKLNTTVSNKSTLQDSIKHRLTLDSSNQKLDSLQRSKWNGNTANQKYDSLQLLSKQNKVTPFTDSLNAIVNKSIQEAEHFTDTLKQKIEGFADRKIDSVKRQLNKPIEKLNSKISDAANPLEQKIEHVNERFGEKTEKVESSIHQAFDKATDGNIKSAVKLDRGDVNLPNPNSIPGVNVSNPDLPGMDTAVPAATVSSGSLQIPNTDLNVDALKTKANIDLPNVDGVKDAQGQLGQVDSKLKEVEKYETDLKGLKQADSASIDNVAKQLQDKVAGLDEVKGVKEQEQLLTKQQLEYNAMMQRYQDKKLLKDEIARKSRNVVNGKIDKLSPAFKEAQEKIAKAKKLNSNAEKFKDGKIKRENEMASKPLYERLVPGVTLQVYNKDVFTIDWGLQLGYKFSNRVIAGVGGVYRMDVSDKFDSYVSNPGIYGYRLYGCFNIKKGFYAHGEFESLHLNTFIHPQTQVEVPTHSAYSAYFGIGKRYDISKKLRGSAIVLYRAEFKGDIPSMSKINLRIGFDLNTKKRTKLKSIATKTDPN